MTGIMVGPPMPEHARSGHLPGGAFAAAIAGALALCVFHAGAQAVDQPDAQPAFEVASAKLHVQGSGGGRNDPGRFILGGYGITGLVMWAYGLQRQQVVGPAWMDSVLLDINAKMPEGSNKAQIPRMLQTLLAERLKLAVHRESRTMSVYELMVGRDGPRMKEVDPSKFVDAILWSPVRSGFSGELTMGNLAKLLSEQLDRLVLDSTGLKAIYDVTLHWTPDEASALPGPNEPGPQPLPVTTGPSNIFPAIQRDLGLKLEARREPVEVLVVDHVERVPTEN